MHACAMALPPTRHRFWRLWTLLPARCWSRADARADYLEPCRDPVTTGRTAGSLRVARAGAYQLNFFSFLTARSRRAGILQEADRPAARTQHAHGCAGPQGTAALHQSGTVVPRVQSAGPRPGFRRVRTAARAAALPVYLLQQSG